MGLRRPAKPREAASLSQALLCLGILLPAYVLLSGWLAQFREAPLSVRLLGGMAATAVLFGGLPLAAAWRGRVSLRNAFAWRTAPPVAIVGALVLGVSLWPRHTRFFW